MRGRGRTIGLSVPAVTLAASLLAGCTETPPEITALTTTNAPSATVSAAIKSKPHVIGIARDNPANAEMRASPRRSTIAPHAICNAAKARVAVKACPSAAARDSGVPSPINATHTPIWLVSPYAQAARKSSAANA